MNRLFRKIYQHFFEIQVVAHEHTEDAEVLVIAYGSVARSRPAGRCVMPAIGASRPASCSSLRFGRSRDTTWSRSCVR